MIHCLLSMNYLSAFARFSIGDFFSKRSFYIWEISPLSLIVVVNIMYLLTLLWILKSKKISFKNTLHLRKLFVLFLRSGKSLVIMPVYYVYLPTFHFLFFLFLRLPLFSHAPLSPLFFLFWDTCHCV